ncbi:MAG: T9SS type A sorting domain-containing protein, partial [Bacteroidota bacterium]
QSRVEGILKVDLSSFNGRVMNEGNQLNWSVQNETEVEYHVLERRFSDDPDFSEIYRVEGQNIPSNISEYNYMDETIAELAYYRIRSVEKNGEVSLSHVLALSRELSEIKVFPNPTFGPLSVHFSSNKDERVNFSIIDKLGKVHFMRQKDLVEGHNLVTFDIKDIPAGVYYLEIATRDQNIRQKIIKEVF